jgi:hypothetical protein
MPAAAGSGGELGLLPPEKRLSDHAPLGTTSMALVANVESIRRGHRNDRRRDPPSDKLDGLLHEYYRAAA